MLKPETLPRKESIVIGGDKMTFSASTSSNTSNTYIRKRKISPNAAAEIGKPSRAIYILPPSKNIDAYIHTFGPEHVVVPVKESL